MELKKARGLEAYFLIPSTTKGLKWGYLWVSLGTPPPKVWNLLVSGSLSNTIKTENLLSENKKRRNINIKYFFEISTYQPGHPNIFPWCCHEKKTTGGHLSVPNGGSSRESESLPEAGKAATANGGGGTSTPKDPKAEVTSQSASCTSPQEHVKCWEMLKGLL